MARTVPSETDKALIAEAKRRGFSVTPTQLERREQAYLVRNPRRSQGRGRGSTSVLRDDIVVRVVQLAAVAKAGKSLGVVGWVFWALNDNKASAKRLRGALLAAVDRPLARAGLAGLPDGDSEEAFTAREEAAARLLHGRRAPRRDFDSTLRKFADEAGYALPRLPYSLPNVYDRALLKSGARMLVGGTGQVGIEEVLESWERAWPHLGTEIESIRRMHIDAGLAGDDLMARSPLADGITGLRRPIEEADDRALCEAVRACTFASGVLGQLLQQAVHEPLILNRLMNDVMWDQWVRIGGVLVDGRAGEAAVALSTIQYLLIPGWAKDLERYTHLMQTLLNASY